MDTEVIDHRKIRLISSVPRLQACLGEVTRIFNLATLNLFEVSSELDWTFVRNRTFGMLYCGGPHGPHPN